MSDPKDETEFLKAHAGRVYNLALRLTGNPSDAEDLAQEALIRALKALPGFRGESEASTWLHRITVNAWKNRVRAEKRRRIWKTLPLSIFSRDRDEEEGSAEPPAEDRPPDAALSSAETAEQVQKALGSLEEESRAVVVLREIEGLSYQDISKALDIPEGTVKSRLARARTALKEKLSAFLRAE